MACRPCSPTKRVLRMLPDTPQTRQEMIDVCLAMNASGLNQGTSGNVSVRVAEGLLITPSALPYAEMRPEHIVKLPMEGPGAPTIKPSTEWQFHQAILATRPDVMAVVHAHPVHATALSTLRQPIPPVHYMIAAFGGADVPVTGYALFGSETLAQMVSEALRDRDGCLLANHGAITTGTTLAQALWRMQELETLAQVYALARSMGDPVLLSEAEIDETLTAFSSYRPVGTTADDEAPA